MLSNSIFILSVLGLGYILILLSKAKLHAQKYDFIANGTLDNLIRKSLITNEMATSLMNDSSYAYDISKKLVSMAEILYNYENNDFLIDDVDDTIKQRLEEKDLDLTAAMWGAGNLMTSAEPAALEQKIANEHSQINKLLSSR